MNWVACGVAFLGVGLVSWAGLSNPSDTTPPPAVPAAPTYSAHVARILNDHCVTCHRPGEVAPFSLVGYDNARKWASMLALSTGKGNMPPWKAVAGYGEFRDANILSPEDRKVLANWAATGAKRGDKASEPAPPTFPVGEWALGKPNIILQPEKAYQLAADGADVYRNFVLSNRFDKPMYVSGVDVKPGNKQVVHHVIVFLDGRHAGRALQEATRDGQTGYDSEGGGVGFLPTGSLGGWAPGIRARRLAEGTAYVIPPNTDLVLQVHYHKSGKAETDLTRVGLYTQDDPPHREMNLRWILNPLLRIPAGESAHKMRTTVTYRKPITVYAAMPHMHLLGREMKSWFELPDGTTKPLVNVKDWDFNWQLNYVLKDPLHLPAGTRQVTEAIYDNSATNPRNPNDPPKAVSWGEETTDEMFLIITSYTED